MMDDDVAALVVDNGSGKFREISTTERGLSQEKIVHNMCGIKHLLESKNHFCTNCMVDDKNR